MKRLAVLLSAALLAGSLAMFTSVSPASADTDVCVGQGTATLGSGLTYPLPNLPAKLTTFTFGFGLGACLAKPLPLSASGTVHGYCGFSFGSGTTNNGHTFKWLGVGGTLYVYGHLTGVVNAAPDPTVPGNSCLIGATSFLINGAVVLTHL